MNTDVHALLGRHDVDHTAHQESEKRTRWVVLLTAVMMVVELVAGYVTHSMALTADAWHMATHVGALGLSALAYWFARTRAGHTAFTFGTGKVYALAGYTSAAGLFAVAAVMLLESVARFLSPETVLFAEALPVAVLGLVVNLVSAVLLGHGSHTHSHSAHDHQHGHDHHHAHDHAHTHHDDGHTHAKPATGTDHNLKAAYVHVLADALTSVLAIVALVAGRYLGWTFLDPAMGIVGALLIAQWSIGLIRQAGSELLDASPSEEAQARIRMKLEAVDDVKVADLHLWTMGPGRVGCIAAILTSRPREACEYRNLLASEKLSHLTVEVHTVAESATTTAEVAS